MQGISLIHNTYILHVCTCTAQFKKEVNKSTLFVKVLPLLYIRYIQLGTPREVLQSNLVSTCIYMYLQGREREHFKCL